MGAASGFNAHILSKFVNTSCHLPKSSRILTRIHNAKEIVNPFQMHDPHVEVLHPDFQPKTLSCLGRLQP
jgi:hypothetical protein